MKPNMAFWSNKKGIIMHPGSLFVVGVIVGIVLVILVIRGVINIPLNLCPK